MSKVIPLYIPTSVFQTLERRQSSRHWYMGTFDSYLDHYDVVFWHFEPRLGGSYRRSLRVNGVSYSHIYLRRFRSTEPFRYDEDLGCITVRPRAKSLQGYTFPLYPFPSEVR